MSNGAENNTGATISGNEIHFRCKFCQETRPLKDLVVMRQYFPQISVCRTCAAGTRDHDTEDDIQLAESSSQESGITDV